MSGGVQHPVIAIAAMDQATMAMVVIGAVTLLFNLAWRLFATGSASGSVKQRLTAIEQTLQALQADFKKLSDVLVNLADMRGDIRLIDERVSRAENDIHELRHGEGYVLPLRPVPERKP